MDVSPACSRRSLRLNRLLVDVLPLIAIGAVVTLFGSFIGILAFTVLFPLSLLFLAIALVGGPGALAKLMLIGSIAAAPTTLLILPTMSRFVPRSFLSVVGALSGAFFCLLTFKTLIPSQEPHLWQDQVFWLFMLSSIIGGFGSGTLFAYGVDLVLGRTWSLKRMD